MATDQKKIREDVRHWIEAVNARDFDRIDKLADEITTAEFEVHVPGEPNSGRGPSANKQGVRNMLQQFPDMNVTLEDLVGEGDRLAQRFTCSYTDGATGKRMSFMVLSIDRYVGNQGAETWQLIGPATEVPA